MARRKKLTLSENAQNDLETLKKNEVFLGVGMFKLRIMGLLGYPDLRKEMSNANEKDWIDVYNKYKA